MACQITIRHEGERVIVQLAGRLAEAQVPDLLEACAKSGGPAILALDDLMSADAVGLDALRRLERRGARLNGLPQYLRLKLDAIEREARS
jgi:hypothetical protein